MLLNKKYDYSCTAFITETPIKRIDYSDFCSLWVKDESSNPTGTHKDRMAFRISDIYLNLINSNKTKSVPSCSLISAGNAALAIGKRFKELSLPPLKVLLDNKIDEKIINFLKTRGCEIYQTDIFEKPLSYKDILTLTNNIDGLDITSYSLLDPQVKFYRDLVLDVLSTKPDVILVPYGSGVLFENFIFILREDPQLYNKIQLIGVTTQNKNSKANKLFSAYSPFDFNKQRLSYMKKFNLIENESQICAIEDNYIDNALGVFARHGIAAEYSGVVGMAYIMENEEHLKKNKRYVIINTGKGLV